MLGFGLRVLQLGHQSLWFDETYSVEMARRGVAAISTNLAGDDLPLHLYLLAGWIRLAGTSEYAVRYLSVVLGVLSLPLFYGLLHRILGTRSALLGCAALTCSAFYVYYGQETRAYTLACLLAVGSLYALLAALRRPDFTRWAMYSLTAIAGLLTFYYVPLVLATINVPVLARRKLRSRGWLLANASAIVLWLPWPLLTYRRTLTTVAERSSGPPPIHPWMEAMRTLAALPFGTTIDAGAAVVPAAILVILVLLGAWQAFTRRTLSGLMLAGYGLLVPLASNLPALITQHHPVYVPRYYLIALPAWIGLAIIGAGWWLHRVRGVALAGMSSAVLLVALVPTGIALRNNYANPSYFRDDYRQAFADIRAQAAPGEALVYDVPDQAVALDYYFARPAIPTIGLPLARAADTQAQLTELSTAYGGVWALFYGEPRPVVESWLDQHFLPVSNHWFGTYVRLKHYVAAPRPASASLTGGMRVEQRIGPLRVSQVKVMPAGADVAVQLFWKVDQAPSTDVSRSLQLFDAAGNKLAQTDGPPLDGGIPTSRWTAASSYLETVRLPLLHPLAPGLYTLKAFVYPVGNVAAAQQATIARLARKKEPAKVALHATSNAGWTVTAAQVGRGAVGELLLELDGIVQATPPADYTWFGHLIDGTGKLVAQDDRPPLAPTTSWRAGDAFEEVFALGQAPGATVELGAYDSAGTRARFNDGSDHLSIPLTGLIGQR